MTTLHVETPNRRSPLRCGFFVLPIALLWFALSSALQAVNPPPDGGYGNQNTAEGTDALFSLTSGVWNVAVGFQALFHDTTGKQNTAVGYKALFSNISGDKSTAYGSQALLINTTGTENVATGFSTLSSNIAGNRNTGVGYRTLAFNNADDNTAIGWNGLFNNRIGVQNTAIGSGALLHGSTFSDNTAVGFQALNNNGGDANTAVGADALFSSITPPATGSNNVALGNAAAFSNSTGSANTAIGLQALANNTLGSGNIAVGIGAGFNLTVGNNNVDIGNSGVAGESGIIRIGAGGTHTDTFLTGLIHAGAVALTGSLSMTDPTTTIQFPGTGGANAPMMSMFASGTANADRMVIAHSPNFPNWGLQYQDSSDTFRFLAAGSPVLTVGLGNSTTTVFGTFVNNSDRNVKEDFAPVNSQAVLDHLQTLPLSTWKYKGADTRRHIGPMAQDFHAAFDGLLDLKSDDKTIAPLDEAGVAFAAIQALQKQVTELRAEKTALAEKLAALEARDQARETRLTWLENALDDHPARVVKAVLDLE